jgi:hypothetical protein
VAQASTLAQVCGMPPDRRAVGLGDVLDDRDQLLGPVALSTCELDKVPRSLNNRAALGRARNRDTSSAAEFEQPLVTELA